MKTATAIYVKTESGDDYLWCVNEKLNKSQVKKFLKEQMGDEYDYICRTIIEYSK
jgi:hypothetical protein